MTNIWGKAQNRLQQIDFVNKFKKGTKQIIRVTKEDYLVCRKVEPHISIDTLLHE